MREKRYNAKIGKADFEARLVGEFQAAHLTVRATAERMNLYYLHGVHIATHSRGRGWIFK